MSGSSSSNSYQVTGKPAAAPGVPGMPKPPTGPKPWKVEAPHGKDLVVHTDTLAHVSNAIKSQIKDLDNAISQLRSSSQALGSLSRWSTGKGFADNFDAAREGFLTAAGQASNAHAVTAQNLYDTAQTYEEAEQTIKANAKKIGQGGANTANTTNNALTSLLTGTGGTPASSTPKNLQQYIQQLGH